MKIKILIANKYFLMSYAIKCILNRIKEFEVVGTSEEELVAAIGSEQPDILFVDIEIVKSNYHRLLRDIREQFPFLKIIVLMDPVSNEKIFDILQLDLNGYMLKNASKDDLCDAAGTVHRGEKYYSKEIQQLMHDRVIGSTAAPPIHESLRALSKREKEIFDMLSLGMTTSDIADNLYLSKHTVLTHRKKILKKMNASSIPQLIITFNRSLRSAAAE